MRRRSWDRGRWRRGLVDDRRDHDDVVVEWDEHDEREHLGIDLDRDDELGLGWRPVR